MGGNRDVAGTRRGNVEWQYYRWIGMHGLFVGAVTAPSAILSPVVEQAAEAVNGTTASVKMALFAGLIVRLLCSLWESRASSPPGKPMVLGTQLVAITAFVALAAHPTVATLWIALMVPAVSQRFAGPVQTVVARQLNRDGLTGRFYAWCQATSQGVGLVVRIAATMLVTLASFRWVGVLFAVVWAAVVVVWTCASWPAGACVAERAHGGTIRAAAATTGRAGRRSARVVDEPTTGRREHALWHVNVALCAAGEFFLALTHQQSILRWGGDWLEHDPFGLAAVDLASYVVVATVSVGVGGGLAASYLLGRMFAVRSRRAAIVAVRWAAAAAALVGLAAAVALVPRATADVEWLAIPLMSIGAVCLYIATFATNTLARTWMSQHSLGAPARVAISQAVGLAVGIPAAAVLPFELFAGVWSVLVIGVAVARHRRPSPSIGVR